MFQKMRIILWYGAEVWGMDECDIFESVHLLALKRFFFSNAKCNDFWAILADFLCPSMQSWEVLYWLKDLNMDDDRLPQKVYEMMLCTCIDNSLWASKIFLKNVI